MTYSQIELFKNDRVGKIILNRPKFRNALSHQLVSDLVLALKELESDQTIRSIILSGNGPVFCSGIDLLEHATEEMEHKPEDWQIHIQRFLDLSKIMWDLNKPIVTAVHGAALGAGFDLALLGDITIAGEKTIFGLPEVKRLSAELTLILPWVTGMKKAKELLLMGDSIDAREAFRLGLINKIVPEENVLSEAEEWARTLANRPEMTLRMNKLAINKAYEIMGFKTALDFNLETAVSIYMTPTIEQREERNRFIRENGVKAWLQREQNN